jgi:integrase
MINLASVETRTQEKAAGATIDQIKNTLFQYSWWLKKEGYAETTITTRAKLLRILAKRGADLHNPESIKETIARQEKWCNKRKLNAADAYTSFLKMTGGTWTPPRYQVEEKLPFIPTEAELDALIAGCGPKTSTFLRLLKETGMRAGEAHRLQWIDIDPESGTIRVTPEKGSKPRVFKLSTKLLSMLMALKGKYGSNGIFSKQLRTQRKLFQKQRAALSRKLQNPRLLQIHFHTFRHWKATMEYQRTRDILYVMNLLGHRSIKNTLVYTHFIEFKDDEFISKVATNAEEASKLVEAAFDYVCTTPENLMLFRKRK